MENERPTNRFEEGYLRTRGAVIARPPGMPGCPAYCDVTHDTVEGAPRRGRSKEWQVTYTGQPTSSVASGGPEVEVDTRKTYVLDTSVLLSDPRAMLRFAEHSVVLPVVVITELEGKRHHPELGYFARQALRLLDELRLAEGRLDHPVSVGDAGGTLEGGAQPHRPGRPTSRVPPRRQRHPHPRRGQAPGRRGL